MKLTQAQLRDIITEVFAGRDHQTVDNQDSDAFRDALEGAGFQIISSNSTGMFMFILPNDHVYKLYLERQQ